jgi:hypothetical protein
MVLKKLILFALIIFCINAADDIVTIDNGQIIGNIYENARVNTPLFFQILI